MYRIALHVIISQINNITLMFSSGVCFFFFTQSLCFWALSILTCMLNLVHSFLLLYSSPVTEYMMAYYPFSLTFRFLPISFITYYTMLFLLRFFKISILLRYIIQTIEYTHFKCAAWWVYTHGATTTVTIQNISVTCHYPLGCNQPSSPTLALPETICLPSL